MKYRVAFWATCVAAMFSAGAAVVNGVIGHWPWMALSLAAIPLDLNSARIFRKHMPKRVLVNCPTRHDVCVAEINRLERELAADGVLFLQSDTEFDREIERVTTAWRSQQAPVIAPPPRPKVLGGAVKNASAICPIGGQSYANCACDPRWAQIYYCPARRGQ